MTKIEIIEVTLQNVDYRRNPFPAEIANPEGLKANDDQVIAELEDRLPEGDIKTCEEFEYLRAECCDNCHTSYPHYDMYLVSLPDGSHGWICCSVRRALLNLDSDPDYLRELAALKEALGGNLSKTRGIGKPEASSEPAVGIFFVRNNDLWVDSTPVHNAVPYGNMMAHDKGHDAYWQELQAFGVVPLDEEYDAISRGRVSFNTKTQTYHILLDNCILTNDAIVSDIFCAMNLPPKPATKIGLDSHYRCPGCMHQPTE
jgi:hypothetical protein